MCSSDDRVLGDGEPRYNAGLEGKHDELHRIIDTLSDEDCYFLLKILRSTSRSDEVTE